MNRHRTFSIAARPSRCYSGFTLIEILVVVAIILIVASIVMAVGVSSKNNAHLRNTKTALKTLDGLMKEYLAAGNPEPQPATTPPTWVQANSGFAWTKPASDAVNWVKAFRASPQIAAKLSNLTTGTTSNGDIVILDSFGIGLRYVPSQTNSGIVTQDGYFMSAGADRMWSMEDWSAEGASAPAQPRVADEIFSTDPL